MKKFNWLFLVIFIVLLFVSCGKKENVEIKDSIKVALAYKPRSFDPHKNTDSSTLAVTKQIYDNLFTLVDGEIVPELVDKYDINIDNSITLHLKKNVLFQDGSELTSEIVKKSLFRNLETPVTRVLVQAIKDIEILDKYTLKIIQDNSPSILLHNFAHSSIAIVKEVENSEINLVGTGCYKILDWGVGENIKLTVFDKCFWEKPMIKNINFVIIPETTNRLIGLETKEIDIAYDIAPTDIKSIENNEHLKYINSLSLGTDFLGINTKKITDKRVRQAIEYAIDKENIIKAVYEGYSSIPNSILTPSVFGYNKELPIREYNPQKAKELLKEAGVQNLTLSLWIYDEPTRRQMAQIIQANLKEIGIDVNIQIVEVPTFLQYTGAGEQDMLIGLWYTSTQDADYGYFPLLHSSSRGNIGNRSFYSNPEVDRYLEDARYTTNSDKRKEYYTLAQKIIYDEVPLFPIAYKNYTIGMQKNIEGFIFNPNGNHSLNKIYIK